MTGVDEVPAGVNPEAWIGMPATLPAVGELWLLSWNGEVLGQALVSGVSGSFAMVWPVTLPSEPAFRPAVALPSSPLGIPLNLWPTRETGVGFHVFDRRFGQLLSRASMEAVGEEVDEGLVSTFPFVDSNLDSQAIEEENDRMIDHWEEICLNVWPEVIPGRSPLARAALDRANLSVSRIQQLLTLEVPQSVALYRGELIPTPSQVEALSVASTVDADLLLLASDDGIRLSISPVYKRRFVELISQLDLTESEVRDLARQDLALAARSDGSLANKLSAVLDRMSAKGV